MKDAPCTQSPQGTLLSIEHATVVKSGKRVLDDISLAIHLGGHTAIIGPNGSGKSSLIKLLTREYYPLARIDDQPTVRILGKDRWNIFELRTQLGIVSADLHNDFLTEPELTGFDVALSGFFATKGIAPHQHVVDEQREIARHALDRMAAGFLANRPIGEMSTGEVRRCLIARALVSRPLALILDEPTTGLDMVAQQRFMESIRGLARAGTTIILVTHHVQEIIPEISRVVLLREGKIAATGEKKATLTAANLSSAFGWRIALTQHHGYYSAAAAEAVDEEQQA
ncbi:MAG: ATP-binding cassette domain-containing protein [Capsulimonadaceae bacterium]|nr:ATP-binding cassette domain-containing protein [Capsulimonadaceae bacterium]